MAGESTYFLSQKQSEATKAAGTISFCWGPFYKKEALQSFLQSQAAPGDYEVWTLNGAEPKPVTVQPRVVSEF